MKVPPERLAHPNRQRILEHVREHPGASLRELCRATGLPWGTLRHHVAVLVRAGLLVACRTGRSRRLFTPAGRKDLHWLHASLLRDPALAELHAWLQENQPASRTSILDAMEARGWSRSTTHYRLKRLAKNGLARLDPPGAPTGYAAIAPAGIPRK